MKRIGWLLGWAIPEAWFAAQAREVLPKAEHVFTAAAPDVFARLEAAGPFDWVVGYSLGSLLLLRDVARAERLGRVALLAPIFDFAREGNAGGRVARTQLRHLARWLRREPQAALADFYLRAGLDVPVEQPGAATLDELSWGLERLAQDVISPQLPPGWSAWCGANDPLLDAVRLKELVPSLVVVPEAGHHSAALLQAFSKEVA